MSPHVAGLKNEMNETFFSALMSAAVEKNKETWRLFAIEAGIDESNVGDYMGVILTDHIRGDCSPPRALCYTQRTSPDTPEGATERQTTPRMSGGTPPPVAT